MRRLIIAPFVVLAALLTGCSGAVSTPQASATTEPQVMPNATNIATEVVETQALPTATMVVEAVEETTLPMDECVVCHTDRQRLTDTAETEESGEGESSGVG